MPNSVARALRQLTGAPFRVSKALEAGAVTGRDTADDPQAGGAALKKESLDRNIRPPQGAKRKRRKGRATPQGRLDTPPEVQKSAGKKRFASLLEPFERILSARQIGETDEAWAARLARSRRTKEERDEKYQRRNARVQARRTGTTLPDYDPADDEDDEHANQLTKALGGLTKSVGPKKDYGTGKRKQAVTDKNGHVSVRTVGRKAQPPGKEAKAPALWDEPEKLLYRNGNYGDMIDTLGTAKEVLAWVARNHSHSRHHQPNTYYRVEGGTGAGFGGAGNGVYLGRDRQALVNFYDQEEKGLPVTTYHGAPKWLDLTSKRAMAAFEKKLGAKMTDSDQVGPLVRQLGYDGIRYYDPQATGEEFVLFNAAAIKKKTDAVTKALTFLTTGKHRAPVSVTRNGKTHIEMRLVGRAQPAPAAPAAPKPARMMTAATAQAPALGRADFEALATRSKTDPWGAALRARTETVLEFWDDSFTTKLLAQTTATAQQAIQKLATKAPQAYVDTRALRDALLRSESFQAPTTIQLQISATANPADTVTVEVGPYSGTINLVDDNDEATPATRALLAQLTPVPDAVEKAIKRLGLQRKQLTDKRGHRTTRWVRPDLPEKWHQMPKKPVPPHIGLALLEKRTADGDWRDVIRAYEREPKHRRMLDPDDLREQLAAYGYNRQNVDDYVRFSSAAGKVLLNQALDKLRPGQRVRLILGLPGAGKSYARHYLHRLKVREEPAAFTYDGAITNTATFHDLIGRILQKGAIPDVLYVHNNPDKALRQATQRYLDTGRPMRWGFFSEAVEGYQNRLQDLLAYGDKIRLRVVNNAGPKPKRETKPERLHTPAFTLDQFHAVLHEFPSLTPEEKDYLLGRPVGDAPLPARPNRTTAAVGTGGQRKDARHHSGGGLSGVVQKALAALCGPPATPADPAALAWLNALDPIEKGRAVPVGTITRLTDGRMSIKTPRGWRIYHGAAPKKRRKPKKIATNFSHNGKNYHIARENGDGPVVIRRENGEPYTINSPQRRALVNAYVEAHKAEWKGKKFIKGKPGMLADDYARAVAQKSANPMEVALEWLSVPPAELTPREEALRDWMLPTSPESWARWGDRNQLTPQLRRNFISRKGGSHRALDVQAQDLSEQTGLHFDPQDLIDFALKFPGGPKSASAENPLRASLEQRFRQLTGLDLTGDVALTLTKVDQVIPRKPRARPAPRAAASPQDHLAGDGHQPTDSAWGEWKVITGPAQPADADLEQAFTSLFGHAPAKTTNWTAPVTDDVPF